MPNLSWNDIRQRAIQLISKVSSETRHYMPIRLLASEIITSGSALVFPEATKYHSDILSSAMHMACMRQVCGRFESRYQYSVGLVYNNFPWPMDATEAQQAKVEECAQTVLDIRQRCLDDGSTLADLYDPLYMPAPLLKAHQALDCPMNRCYRPAKSNTCFNSTNS